MATHLVSVGPIPPWIDFSRLLGPGQWLPKADSPLCYCAQRTTHDAADLAARLRGVIYASSPVSCTCIPPLPRAAVRGARTTEARRLRHRGEGFSRAGVQRDEVAHFSLTPEALALQIGVDAREHFGPDAVVFDACCGAGGNAIGFARAGVHVIACEINKARAAMARHNARIYGVEKRIQVHVGDARKYAALSNATLYFVDPPWGDRHGRDADSIQDLAPLADMMAAANTTATPLWAKLPPAFPADRHFAVNRLHAYFGTGLGDHRRVKFVLAKTTTPAPR